MNKNVETNLGLVQHRLVVLVRVAGEGITHLLGGGLLALGLNRGSHGVSGSLELVTEMLGGGLLGIGLQGSSTDR